MIITVIIPAYNSQKTLPALLNSLSDQIYKDFETIVIDDCSQDNTLGVIKSYPFQYIRLNKNSGPAYCRNIGAKSARGDILVFTDSDCRPEKNWLHNIHEYFSKCHYDAIMGKLILTSSNFLGDSISALGFPAGGSVGFEKIWRVDIMGFTESLSSCNCGIKKEIFHKMGGFDESFPYAGGEDSYMAYSLIQAGYKIKYCPDVIVFHEARNSFKDFLRWQFRRGESSYLFSKKIKEKKDYIKLRFWSTKNVILNSIYDIKLPVILILLFFSLVLQTTGAIYGKYMDH